jgi:hypothetical protein
MGNKNISLSKDYLISKDDKLKTKNIVLDLDGTIVYEYMLQRGEEYKTLSEKKHVLYMNREHGTIVFLRPNAIEFIDAIKYYYNIYFYTNACGAHLVCVVNSLQKLVRFKIAGYYYTKSIRAFNSNKTLERFGLKHHNTLIIDDNFRVWSTGGNFQSNQYLFNIINVPKFVIEKNDDNYLNDDVLKHLRNEIIKHDDESDIKKIAKRINKIILSEEEFNTLNSWLNIYGRTT